jgi:hypothetical protein
MYESSGVLQIKTEQRCSHVFLCYSSLGYQRTRECACMESSGVSQIKRKTQNVMFARVVAQKSNQMPYERLWSTANKTICTALHAFLCYFLKPVYPPCMERFGALAIPRVEHTMFLFAVSQNHNDSVVWEVLLCCN